MFRRIKRRHRGYCPRRRSIFRQCICNKNRPRVTIEFTPHPDWVFMEPWKQER